MLSTCANPECSMEFDYREGKLFRFHKNHAPGEPRPNTHCVQHFWLCGRCAATYTLDYCETTGVLLRTKTEHASHSGWNCLIAAA